MNFTQDLSELGYREIGQLADLLRAYASEGTSLLGNEVKWEYNPNSDNLFLFDEDNNVAMLNGHHIELFHTCGYCGHEGFQEDFDHEPKHFDCSDQMDQVKSLKN